MGITLNSKDTVGHTKAKWDERKTKNQISDLMTRYQYQQSTLRILKGLEIYKGFSRGFEVSTLNGNNNVLGVILTGKLKQTTLSAQYHH